MLQENDYDRMPEEIYALALEANFKARIERNNNSSMNEWVSTQIKDYSINIPGLLKIISKGEREKIIQPGQTGLELGSGTGSATITFASKGYNMIGIELNPKLVEISRETINKAKIINPEINAQIHQGSYYPEEYIKLRKKSNSLAAKFEDDVANELHWKGDKSALYLHLNCKEKVYKNSRIDFSKIDFFYSYTWIIQAPSVLEMFKLYAGDDAKMFLFGVVKKKWLDEIGLEEIPKPAYHEPNAQMRFIQKLKNSSSYTLS
jgi:SAM-dependent methyltransferase